MNQHDKRPTDGELEILRILWDQGPSTVREVHQVLEERRGAGHTTVLKMMQIMTDKGLLERDTSVRPQIFSPVRSRERVQRRFLDDLLERVFEGSAAKLVLQALSSKPASSEELVEIRRLLDELEEEKP